MKTKFNIGDRIGYINSDDKSMGCEFTINEIRICGDTAGDIWYFSKFDDTESCSEDEVCYCIRKDGKYEKIQRKIKVFKEQNSTGDWFVTSVGHYKNAAFVSGMGSTLEEAISDLIEFISEEFDDVVSPEDLDFVEDVEEAV